MKRVNRRQRRVLQREPLARVGLLALLQQLTELSMSLGQDPDGSATVGRFMGILGEQAEISRGLPDGDGPFTPDLVAAREALGIEARRAEPILARIARPDGRMA